MNIHLRHYRETSSDIHKTYSISDRINYSSAVGMQFDNRKKSPRELSNVVRLHQALNHLCNGFRSFRTAIELMGTFMGVAKYPRGIYGGSISGFMFGQM